MPIPRLGRWLGFLEEIQALLWDVFSLLALPPPLLAFESIYFFPVPLPSHDDLNRRYFSMRERAKFIISTKSLRTLPYSTVNTLDRASKQWDRKYFFFFFRPTSTVCYLASKWFSVVCWLCFGSLLRTGCVGLPLCFWTAIWFLHLNIHKVQKDPYDPRTIIVTYFHLSWSLVDMLAGSSEKQVPRWT